jgi:glycosyltransferase involved in cell wall biosynthesis
MISGSPAVSVIIPTFNTARYIGTALASVFAQTVQDFEVIVINDGSPDTPDLERVLAPYRDRIRYLVQDNSGVSAARNAGVRAARAPLVATLDSDDAWEPNYLEVQLAALAADPSLDVVYPNARIVGDHPHAGRLYMDVCPSRGPVTFEAIVTQRCNVFTSVLARRETLLRAGLYDERSRAAEDFELWVRVVASGGRIGYHRHPLVHFNKRRGSLSSDPVWMTEQGMQVYDRLAHMPNLTARQRTVLDDRRAWFRATLALNRGKRAFFRLDAAEALPHLREANRYFRSVKLTAVCTLLRFTPTLLLNLYRWRDRHVMRTSTQF